jgi:hypothetical protein
VRCLAFDLALVLAVEGTLNDHRLRRFLAGLATDDVRVFAEEVGFLFFQHFGGDFEDEGSAIFGGFFGEFARLTFASVSADFTTLEEGLIETKL